MARGNANQILWGRAALCALLAYVLLIRLALPVAMPQAQEIDELLANPHVLCLSDASWGPDQTPQAPPRDHGGCGECCLNVLRLVFDAPCAACGISSVQPTRQASPVVYELQPRGPPAEAWSRERAQRAPPAI